MNQVAAPMVRERHGMQGGGLNRGIDPLPGRDGKLVSLKRLNGLTYSAAGQLA